MFARALGAAALVVGVSARPVPSASVPASTVIRVVAHDYSFTVPGGASARVLAGPVTLRLVNRGKVLHMMGVVYLGTASVEDLLRAVEHDAPLKGMYEVGGVNGIAPGDSATTTVMLEPGNAALACWVVNTDGKLHVDKGMIAPLTVVADAGPAPAAPRADLSITLRDYTIALSAQPRAGHHVFRVVNDGSMTHDVELMRMDPGARTADLDAWYAHPEVGSRLAQPIAGTVGLEKGLHDWFSANLTPGDYVLICWMPDAKNVPHYDGHHMLLRFHVAG